MGVNYNNSAMSDDAAGRIIADRYEIVRTLGQGAFGRTFLARDTGRGRQVAIKLLDARGAPDWKAYELFEREATVLRSLRHHGIPEIFEALRDAWNGADAAFLVMEYVEGTSLGQLIEQRIHIESGTAFQVFLELLGILEYLHSRVPPILHRDIKPSNIIVRANGFPALVDFGSVRNVFLAPDEASSTIAGTYGYMPYEQYMGQASPSSDLYSAAATMLHVLTGRAPKDFMNAEGRIEVPDSLPGEQRLREVLARMLRPSPAERFASAHDVRQALLASVALAPIGASRTAAAGPPRRAGAVAVLPPAPRELTGATREQFDRVAHSMWQLMEPNSKPRDSYGVLDIAVFAFFSMLTAGILPASFYAMARARKRRLRRFFREGTPAIARILGMDPEDVGWSVKLTRVRYEFEADGEIQRDADLALPSTTIRWRVGETVAVLYIADEGYDSVIVTSN
jgi:serine/threonine protein kinase